MDELKLITELGNILQVEVKELHYNSNDHPTTWLRSVSTLINDNNSEKYDDYSHNKAGYLIYSTQDDHVVGLAFHIPNEKYYENFDVVVLPTINRISELTQLEIFYFHSKSVSLPRSIENLPNLKCLDLYGKIQNTLKYAEFKDPLHVQYLYLRGNNLQTYPGTLENIAKYFLDVKELDLRSNRLSSIPDIISNLTNLEKLDLRDNNLISLPKSIGKLSKLNELYLSNNQLRTLPNDLKNLVDLERLDLGRNNLSIQDIQGWIGQLTKLVNLDLRENYFDSLPNSIENLSKLKILNISGNYGIKDLELLESIGKLTQLNQLYLNDTKLEKIPHSFINLNQLWVFQIKGTPLHKLLPPEILRQSSTELIRYILDIQQDSKKLNESKLLIVGEGGVGKSCTLRMITDDNYAFNPDEPSTEGIDIDKWTFTEDGNEYKLNIWDFGGQEIYHSTHQFFLSRRSLYLLMWSARRDATAGRVDYWLKTITTLAGNSPIILVMNQCDNEQRLTPFNLAEYQEKYPQIKGCIQISCKDNIPENRGKLRDIIQKEVKNLPLMEEKWSLKRYGVREDLEKYVNDNQNYIPYETYKEICKRNQLIDNIDIESLIKQLNDLGIVTYHSKDNTLKGYVILSPEWITNAVYSIIDEQQKTLKDRNGILELDDLPQIWKDEDQYPRHMYTFLLKMMESFDLAFHIVNNQYLIAELLEAEPLPSPWKFTPKLTRKFNYHYEDYLPAGIMTRFIVRINEFLYTNEQNKKSCWRYGAYLEHNGVKASVKLREIEKTISIEVCGNEEKSRKDFLTIIRNHIDAINNIYTHLNVKRTVPCCCSTDCKHEFDYDRLLERAKMGKQTAECERTFADVNIERLGDGIKDISDIYLNSFDNLSKETTLDDDWIRRVKNILYVEFAGVKKDTSWHEDVKKITDMLSNNTLSDEEKLFEISTTVSRMTSREPKHYDNPYNYLRWLHLSDIHIGYHEGGISNSDFRATLPRYLKDKFKGVQFDCLFITGDLHYAKTVSSPTEYITELVDFVSVLKKELSIDDSQLFIVPGNHDLRFWNKEEKDPQLNERNTCIEKLRTGGYWSGSGRIELSDLTNLLSDLKEYEGIYEKLTGRKWEGVPIKPHFVIQTQKANLLHLNTVLTISNKYDSDIIIGRERLNLALKNIDTNKPTIVLAHYPFEYIFEKERKLIENDLRDKGNAVLYLCGHRHTALHKKIDESDESHPIHEFICGTNMDNIGTPNWQAEMIIFSGCMDITTKSGYVEAYKWVKDSHWVLDNTFSHPQRCAEDGRLYFPESARNEKDKFP